MRVFLLDGWMGGPSVWIVLRACVNYQKYNPGHMSHELDKHHSSLENAKKQVQWLCNVVRILNSSNLLVEVSIDTAKLTKYYDLQKRLNKYHLPLRLSFSKRHPIQVQKTWLFGLSTFRSTAAFEK